MRSYIKKNKQNKHTHTHTHSNTHTYRLASYAPPPHTLDREVPVVSNYPQHLVRVYLHQSQQSIAARRTHHVVGDRDNAVDGLGVAHEAVIGLTEIVPREHIEGSCVCVSMSEQIDGWRGGRGGRGVG